MDLRQLATFRTVATTLNFTRAAAQLDYAQSSVTAQIQALETELGVPLFDRLGRRVVLTEAGQRLLRYADKLLLLVEETRSAVTGGAEPLGTLNISAPETLCTYRLPTLLRAARDRLPQVRLAFRPTPVSQLRRAVRDGDLDLAFVLDAPIAGGGLHVEHLLHEPVVVVTPPDHALAQLPVVAPTAFAGASLLLTEAGCAYRVQFERALAEAGVVAYETLEFSSVEAIKQCVIAGMGLAVLPAVAVANEIAHGQLAALHWSGPSLDMATQLIWHSEKWQSPALRALVDLARELLPLAPVISTATPSLML